MIDPTTETTLLAGDFEMPSPSRSLRWETIGGGEGVRSLSIDVDRDGARVLMRLGNPFAGALSGVWSLETGAWVGEAYGCLGAEPGTYLWAEDGFVACSDVGATAFRWSIDFRVPEGGGVQGIALSPGRTHAAVTWFRGDCNVCGVSLFDLTTRTLRWTRRFEGESLVSGPFFAPSGEHVLVGVGYFGDESFARPVTAPVLHVVDAGGAVVTIVLPASAGKADDVHEVAARMEFPGPGLVDVFESLSDREILRHRLAWDGSAAPTILASTAEGQPRS